MRLTCHRRHFTADATISELRVDYESETAQGAQIFGWVCEDQDRGLSQGMALEVIAAIKVQAETAIPVGTYRITLEDSPKYGPDTLTLPDVPGYRYIRIHAGNDDDDTAGCPLPGLELDVATMTVQKSRAAVDWLETQIRAAIGRGEPATWTITRHAPTWRAYRGDPSG